MSYDSCCITGSSQQSYGEPSPRAIHNSSDFRANIVAQDIQGDHIQNAMPPHRLPQHLYLNGQWLCHCGAAMVSSQRPGGLCHGECDSAGDGDASAMQNEDRLPSCMHPRGLELCNCGVAMVVIRKFDVNAIEVARARAMEICELIQKRFQNEPVIAQSFSELVRLILHGGNALRGQQRGLSCLDG